MSYQLNIHNPATGEHWCLTVEADERVLAQAQAQGVALPFSCAQGVCTTCAVKVIQGTVHQPHAFGISQELKNEGYALLCVSYPRSNLRVEVQAEDEVYDRQFGQFFPAQAPSGLPLELE